jgi:hypothetical protein
LCTCRFYDHTWMDYSGLCTLSNLAATQLKGK